MHKKIGIVVGISLLALPALAFGQEGTSVDAQVAALTERVKQLQLMLQNLQAQSAAGTQVRPFAPMTPGGQAPAAGGAAASQVRTFAPATLGGAAQAQAQAPTAADKLRLFDGTAPAAGAQNDPAVEKLRLFNVIDDAINGDPIPPALLEAICLNLTHSFSVDDTDADTGGDVTRLQRFLAQDVSIYPEGRVTGYFGPATLRAVQRWQARAGIVSSGDPETTGYGFIGPKTRAAMMASCKGTRPQQGALKASPTSGPAPLTVNFSARSSDGGTYTIDFGDGASGEMIAPCSMDFGVGCSPNMSLSYTYTANGTYTATLKKTTWQNRGWPADDTCVGDCGTIVGVARRGDSVVVGTVRISVGATNASIQQIYAPADVTLSQGQIAEVRNRQFYFSLESLSAGSATIQIRTVGCFGGFPSDPPPELVCMMMPIEVPLATLSVGQSTTQGDTTITLIGLSGNAATFSVGGTSSTGYSIFPTSGNAPLTVTVTNNSYVVPQWCLATTNGGTGRPIDLGRAYVDFGDGYKANFPDCSGTVQHTYTVNGTYIVSTSFGGGLPIPGYTAPVRYIGTVTVGGGTNVTTFSAYPTSGPAPLGVNFTASNTGNNSKYSVDFGDGSSADMWPTPAVMTPCMQGYECPQSRPSQAVSHKYLAAGTYTATLNKTTKNTCTGGPGLSCALWESKTEIIGTVTLTVAPMPVNAGYLSVTPRSGDAPLTVTVTTTNLPQGAGLDFGDRKGGGGVACGISVNQTTAAGTSTAQTAAPQMRCDFTGQTHTYTTPGTYIVSVSAAGGTIDTVTITVGGTSSGRPVINGLDAPTTLSVGQTGTWTARTSSSNTGNLSYSVIWGDETWAVPADAYSATSVRTVSSSGTFTHAYQRAGTYTPRFTVSNSSGSAQTSATVTVRSSIVACPVYQMIACAPGYHYGPNTTNANGCTIPGPCVPDSVNGIPAPVQTQYDALLPTYGNSLGVYISSCVKRGNDQVYTVTGSGGYTGITYYYNGADGRLLGSVSFSDTPPYLSGVAPVDTSQYTCTQVKSSRGN